MRRKPTTPTLLFLLAAPLCVLAGPQPFQPVETAAAAAYYDLLLLKRQSCITNFYSCASQGSAFTNICCENGQVCALDASNQPACCPSGAVCTGTAPASFVTPSTATGTASASYVSNTFFPFPYVATSFADSAACTSAVSECSANYAACTSELQGSGSGGYGVTIDAGGTTVVAATPMSLAVTSAAGVCSSLSSVACSGLQSSDCSQVGTATGGFVVGSGNGVPRPTAPPRAGVVGAVAAGVGLGILGIEL
ncbi:hypothetical protein NKR23_g101 [Pleurostoma richardsiae]|uniref:Gpi-anchored protein n=1 Tax=Pleurostoma richardsiae TaxID=41990 RepID=A0AA38VQT5_9PEZI|nr:hypothetical protein NKR23_g101 [Pleurostoma richardsiae]